MPGHHYKIVWKSGNESDLMSFKNVKTNIINLYSKIHKIIIVFNDNSEYELSKYTIDSMRERWLEELNYMEVKPNGT